MDKIAVGIGGILLSVFVAWFFFGKRTKFMAAGEKEGLQEIEITVDGGYKPDAVSLKSGKKAVLKFFRKDPSDCLEEVVIGDFGVRKKLPIGEVVSVEIQPEQRGEYDFSCGMGMFHGKIKVQ